MKIIFFYYSMQAGGAERTIARLSDYSAHQGDIVTIVTMDDQSSFYALHPDVTHIRLKVNRQSKNPLQAIEGNFHSIRKIKTAYSTVHPDAVVCFGPNTILLSFLARGGMGYKLIGSERANPYLSATSFWSRHKRRISTLCDGFLFQTEGARSYYPQSTQQKGIILPNSIAASEYLAVEQPWNNRGNLCAVGRMDADKCFDDILVAFSAVHQKFPEVHLNLYGDGPLKGELEQLSISLGLEETVTFHGRCQKMLKAYASNKIFIMASCQEGFPNVLMEALASGCACVAANCDFGPSELIRDGENGFLVPVHDTNAMADRLCRLLEDDTLCHRMSNSAISIRRTHDIAIMGATFRSYLDQV